MNNPTSYKIPPIGERINIGTHHLHARVMGEGKPTVVFEPALGAFALQWFKIQPEIAQVAKTISYDRAGQGWSDFSPEPRTPEQMTSELHRLLTVLNLNPPYILVSHSFGGLLSRYYAQAYSADVSGMILIDTSHPMQYEKIKNFAKMRNNMKFMLKALSFVSRWSLIGKLFSRFSLREIRSDVPQEIWEKLVYISSLPKHHQTVGLEFEHFDQFFGKHHQIPTNFGDLPLTIVTAGNSVLNQTPIGGFTAQELNDAHLQLQAELATMSSNSKHIIVPEATHFSILSYASYVEPTVQAIKEMITNIKTTYSEQ